MDFCPGRQSHQYGIYVRFPDVSWYGSKQWYLYVDTVNQFLAEMPLDKALVEAGAIRMRPILMTTGTTVISMLPNAVAYGKSVP